MAQRTVAAPTAMAQYSRSTQMARALQSCIPLRRPILLAKPPTATEHTHLADWRYRATPYMGRRHLVGLMAMAHCLPSAPTARDLRSCIASVAAMMELIRMRV